MFNIFNQIANSAKWNNSKKDIYMSVRMRSVDPDQHIVYSAVLEIIIIITAMGQVYKNNAV